jgi:hypothetical protein
MKWIFAMATLSALFCSSHAVELDKEILEDPSFEETKERDRYGKVFSKWEGWIYEGDCEFRIGDVAHSGSHSCMLFGTNQPKIRVFAKPELEQGRYRITAYLRGLDIGLGQWNQTTEFAFDGKYMQLKKNGTFGWTKLSYVGEVKEKKKVNGPSFGLMATGFLWIDDVSLVKVADDTPLTENPVLEEQESPIQPPGDLGSDTIRCLQCQNRNMSDWKKCFACGLPLDAGKLSFSGLTAATQV